MIPGPSGFPPASEFDMRRKLVCLVLLTLPFLAEQFGTAVQGADDPYASHIARTPPRTPAEEQKLFHLPPGFDIELVAAEPDIRKPMNLAFDDRGRLWLTDSVEYPFPAPADRR